MDYSDMPEGYGPSHIPFQPSQWQSPYAQSSYGQRPVPPVQRSARVEQRKPQPARMPKAQALALVRRMKKGIVVSSLVCFGTVVGLIVNQTNQAAAQQATQQTTKSASSQTSSQGSSKTSTTSSTNTSSSQSGSSTQGGTSSSTTSSTNTSSSQGTSWTQPSSQQQGGGYGFGSTQAAQPVSGSHTS